MRVDEGVVSSINSGSSSDGVSLRIGVDELVCAVCGNRTELETINAARWDETRVFSSACSCDTMGVLMAPGLPKTSGDMYESWERPPEGLGIA